MRPCVSGSTVRIIASRLLLRVCIGPTRLLAARSSREDGGGDDDVPLTVLLVNGAQGVIDKGVHNYVVEQDWPNHTMKPITFILGLALLATTGCINMKVTDGSRPPTQHVDLFKNGQIPERKFREIAELSVGGERDN